MPTAPLFKPRLPRMRLVAAALSVAAPFAAGGAALAAHSAPVHLATARPSLVASVNAPCNARQKPGYAQCYAIVRTPSDHLITATSGGPPASALGPADIKSAYRLPAGGGGQTVAVVDAFGDSAAESDLAAFRSEYGLSPCTTANGCFRKVDQAGGTAYPADDEGWALETSLDLDAVSSACPACNILLVEADSSNSNDLGTAEDEAVALGAKYVSNSYGVPGEYSTETSDDHFFDHPGVAVTASTGDTGNEMNWPASSPYVTAVGGTTLTKDAGASRGWNESAWAAGGSGCSLYEAQPDFQAGISTGCAKRAIADVAADADPASGLATYDSVGYQGQSGWFKVGGTSLSSPLLAAMYALAGPPASGTYPVTYSYHDPQQSSDLFDITTGSDGSCGTVLCTAGPGWDGPTGLGTPDGVAALEQGQHGDISGQITDSSTSKPVGNVVLTANPGDYVTRTDASGDYDFSLPAGSYDLTAHEYGYRDATASGIQVTAGQTTTQNFTLNSEPSGTLSGTVTDGSGHGWPLHAKITIAGYPYGPVYADPYTGKYSVTLPQGSYQVSVGTDYPGYQARQLSITLGAATTSNITLDADTAACTAPGYGWDGHAETFTSWTGTTAADGWTVSGTGWRFDNPADRPPPMHAPQDGAVLGGDDKFAVADSGYQGGAGMNTSLTSPAVDLSRQTAPVIQFDSAYYAAAGQSASVGLSTDGGRSWSTVWHQGSGNALGPITIPIPQAAGKARVLARFQYAGRDGWYWGIDNVLIGTRTCTALPGGLLAGIITDHVTGSPLDGARVASVTPSQPSQDWQAGLALGTGDPAIPGGLYWLFSPATGSQPFTATDAGYSAATAAVTVTPDQVTHQDWALSPAGGN